MSTNVCKKDLQTINFTYLETALNNYKVSKDLLSCFISFLQCKYNLNASLAILKKDNNLIIKCNGFSNDDILKNIYGYQKIINNKKCLIVNKKLFNFSSSCFFPFTSTNTSYLFAFFKKDTLISKETALDIKKEINHYINFLKIKSNNAFSFELLKISDAFLTNSNKIISKINLHDMFNMFSQSIIKQVACFKSIICYKVSTDSDIAKVVLSCSKDNLSVVNSQLKIDVFNDNLSLNNEKLKNAIFQNNNDKFLVLKNIILNEIYTYTFIFEIGDSFKYLNYHTAINKFINYIYFLINLKDNKKQEIDFEKTVSMSYLSSGTLHYMNNFMQGISSRLELLKMGASENQKLIETIDKIYTSLDNCKDFFKMYSYLISSQNDNTNDISFTDFLYDLYAKFQIEYGDFIDLEIDSLDEKYLVSCDENKLFIAIWEILRNALEFSYEENINIKLNLKYFFKKNQNLGNFLRLTIEDIGRGMSKDVLLRAFEPFFSTKSIDRKTRISPNLEGLGLTISKAIISSFGGYIDMVSIEGRGTSVKIVLPIKL